VVDPVYYFDLLYPFQKRVIKVFTRVETGFYLTGGTAASRGYLQHRFSDDLDYFVNDDNRFGLWVERVIQALSPAWTCEVLMKEERSARLNLIENEMFLKLEFVNDVPAQEKFRTFCSANSTAPKTSLQIRSQHCWTARSLKTWPTSGGFVAR
jgi:hypothetical protein